MDKFLAIVGFLLIGACIQFLVTIFVTDNIFVVSSASGIWMSYMLIWYNKKFGKKTVS